MRAKFYLLLFLSSVFFNQLQAQYSILANAIPSSLPPLQGGGSTPMSVGYNPLFNLYYIVNGGAASVSMQCYDGGTGALLTSAIQNFDYRGCWWNTNLSQFEGNGYGTSGITSQNLNPSNGYPLTTNTYQVNLANPNSQAMGCYDPDANQVVLYYNGSFLRYDRNTGTLSNTLPITGLPVGNGNINSYAVCYTGYPGGEYGIYDYVNKRFYFINKATGAYVATSQLPANAPQQSFYGVAFCNNMLWLYNSSSGHWYSYYVYNGYIIQYCNIPEIHIVSINYAANSSYTTYFGDGTQSLTPALIGITTITHDYLTSGTYTIKNVLATNGVPVDSLIFSYDYQLCNNMFTKYYQDTNGNCQKDSGEIFNIRPISVELDSNGTPIDTTIVTGGLHYRAVGVPGSAYAFKVLSAPLCMQYTCPANGIIQDTLQNTGVDTNAKYQGFKCDTGFDIGAYVSGVHAGTHLQVGNIFILNSCYHNSAVLTLKFSPKYQFQNANIAPTTISGNTVVWDFTTLPSKPVGIQYWLTNSAGYLLIDDTVHSSYRLTPVAGDADTSNNSSTRVDTVKSGYDPNEIEVIPEGIIAAGTQLMYTISFENTGNDTAFNIHIMDTLSDNVDMKTLKLIATSAAMNIGKYSYNGHNILKFDFPNINLLDSSHHGQCDGFVSFYINAKPGLPVGTTIFNEAGIYFDYNDVVMTNTVEDIIGQPQKVQTLQNESNVKLYPNPASDVLTIAMDKVEYSGLTITNSLGQEVLQQAINSAKTYIDISKLPAGVYYVNLNGGSGSVVKKFVKM